MPIDPLAAQPFELPDLDQLACMQTLDTAAELFEASPRETFTRAEVASTLRALKSELFEADCVAAYEIALLDFALPLPLSQPS